MSALDRSISQLISDEQIKDYQNHGAVLLKGLFNDWISILSEGIEYNMKNPSIYGAENVKQGEGGRFFDDYCNWQRISSYEQFIFQSSIAKVAAELMQSNSVQLFHDHVLVKEAGTSKETPWHQDSPYYFVEGQQTVSFWLPLDTVEDASLRLIKGSHLWDKMVLPVKWLDEDAFYPEVEEFLAVPNPDKEPDRYDILSWPMEPGDAIAFHYRTVHGAKGNHTNNRRRAFSLRLLGDDARYVTRPGRTSPPFPNHGMTNGQKLREDWFPILAYAH